MNFNKHSNLVGNHAFLSASKYHWVNYDEEKLDNAFSKYMASQKGEALHKFAADAINLGVRLQKSKRAINMYVNDAIGFKMYTEQILYFSENCFGTADAISFRKNVLRIHDLKTGESPTSIKQLEVYTALFCLEYDIKPYDIEIELRIYQFDFVVVHIPNPQEILRIMEKIIIFDKRIKKLKMEGNV